ncbi:MAG: peptide chain release factor N(5)-glutamine methyltransferase [Dokdonella sp.]
MITLRELLRASTPASDVETRHEAELLLMHVLGRTRAWLFANGGSNVDAAAQMRFAQLLQLRREGRPIAYLIGHRGFWTLDLDVDANVLIPRADTELLVELALERIALDCDCAIADLGTGSGAIALALASERPRARVLASDISHSALEVARANAARLGIGNVDFACADWYEALNDRAVDVIVSNPPYIAADDDHLGRGDLRFEPSIALASGGDGLDALRRIIAQAPTHLHDRGWLLLEHGFNQGEAVRALLAAAGFVSIATSRDLAGHERVSFAQCCGAT